MYIKSLQGGVEAEGVGVSVDDEEPTLALRDSVKPSQDLTFAGIFSVHCKVQENTKPASGAFIAPRQAVAEPKHLNTPNTSPYL